MRVVVSSASAKVRSGGPSDERKDVERGEVTGRVWTGVVPVWEMMGCPLPAGEGLVGRRRGMLSSMLRGGMGGRGGMRRGLLGRCMGASLEGGVGYAIFEGEVCLVII